VLELFPSTFDALTQEIFVELPAAVFFSHALTDQNQQAIVRMVQTPGANQPATGAPALSATVGCQAAAIACPVSGGCTVTSPFVPARAHPVTGQVRPHLGTDYRASVGTPILAAASGVVERSYVSSSFGETIVIRHQDGGATLYAHLSSRNRQEGDQVAVGESLGLSGSTGLSSGPHLHMEYVPNGAIFQSPNRIDPDACVHPLGASSITVGDSGALADDAFELLIDGVTIGQTLIGATNTLNVSGLRRGPHVLTLVVLIAPDDIGTFTVTLHDGLVFADGTTSVTGQPPEGTVIQFNFSVSV
jgi:hypothetical protein